MSVKKKILWKHVNVKKEKKRMFDERKEIYQILTTLGVRKFK